MTRRTYLDETDRISQFLLRLAPLVMATEVLVVVVVVSQGSWWLALAPVSSVPALVWSQRRLRRTTDERRRNAADRAAKLDP